MDLRILRSATIFFFPVMCRKEMMISEDYAARSMFLFPVVCEKEMWGHQNTTQREAYFFFSCVIRDQKFCELLLCVDCDQGVCI